MKSGLQAFWAPTLGRIAAQKGQARRRILCATSLATSLACSVSEIKGIGEFGRPIAAVRDQSELPRLLFAISQDDDNCATLDGACTSICDQRAPGQCDSDACVSILIDSGSPITVLPKTEFELRDRCIALRQGHLREGVAEENPSTEGTVTRFRFENVPTVDAPSIKAGGWEWDSGVYPDPASPDVIQGRIDVGAILGANLLKHFAVRLTASGDDTRLVTFYEQFPGSEASLADQGFSFLRLQFPGRLLGTQVEDRCTFGDGIMCDFVDLALVNQRDDLTFERTRMLLDACVAPPPCAPLWERDSTTNSEHKSCELRPGHSADVADSARTCDDPTGANNGGFGASLVVATGVTGIVIFADSAQRMFGDLGALPLCSASSSPGSNARACLEDDTVELYVPGYPPEKHLKQLRIRSLALVAGHVQSTTDAPCERLEKRLKAAEISCRGLDAFDRPHAPDDTNSLTANDHALILGESYWAAGQDQPKVEQWLGLTVLSASSGIAMNIRREVGSEAIEPDGLIGSALLRQTDVVLDYTESEEKPGVRVACLQRGDPSCQSYPACTSTDSTLGEAAPGRTSCCWSMPDNLVEHVLDRDDNNASACCETLSVSALTRVQALGRCLDVPAPNGIGGLMP